MRSELQGGDLVEEILAVVERELLTASVCCRVALRCCREADGRQRTPAQAIVSALGIACTAQVVSTLRRAAGEADAADLLTVGYLLRLARDSPEVFGSRAPEEVRSGALGQLEYIYTLDLPGVAGVLEQAGRRSPGVAHEAGSTMDALYRASACLDRLFAIAADYHGAAVTSRGAAGSTSSVRNLGRLVNIDALAKDVDGVLERAFDRGEIRPGSLVPAAEVPSGGDRIERLSRWYAEQCDGVWEHRYGIAISTSDNPAWNVGIEIAGTELDGATLPATQVDNGASDWISYSADGAEFHGVGDPSKLTVILDMFFDLIKSVP